VSIIGDDNLAREIYGSALIVDRDEASPTRQEVSGQFHFAGNELDLVHFSALGVNGVQCAASPVRIMVAHRMLSVQSAPLGRSCVPVLLASRCVVLVFQENSSSSSAALSIHSLLHSLEEIVPAAHAAEGPALDAGSTMHSPPFGHLHLVLPTSFMRALPPEELLQEIMRMETAAVGRPLQKDQHTRNTVRRAMQVAFATVRCSDLDAAGVSGRQFQVSALRRSLVPQLRHVSALSTCADSRLLVPLSRFVQQSGQLGSFENALPALLNFVVDQLVRGYQSNCQDRALQALNGVLTVQDLSTDALHIARAHAAATCPEAILLPPLPAELLSCRCVVLSGLDESRKSYMLKNTAQCTLRSTAVLMQALADRYSPSFAADLQATLAQATSSLAPTAASAYQGALLETYKSALELSCDLANKQCDKICAYLLEHVKIASPQQAKVWQPCLAQELTSQVETIQQHVLCTFEGRGLPLEMINMRKQALIDRVQLSCARLGRELHQKLTAQVASLGKIGRQAAPAAETTKAVDLAVRRLQQLVPQLIRQFSSAPSAGKYRANCFLCSCAVRGLCLHMSVCMQERRVIR